MMARLLADPERVAARLKKSVAGRDSETYRAAHRRKLAKQRRSKVFREAEVARGRETVARWNADPVVKGKATDAMRETLAVQWSKRVAVPVILIPQFRVLRRKRFSVEEAREILRQANRAEFERFDAEHRAAAMRAIGPVPAIGTPGRAAWTRRAQAVIAGQAIDTPASRALDGEGRL